METLNPPTISLVIPALNEEKYIKDCLDSVISSGANFLEIIVVDNGSTDKTKEIVESYNNIRIVREEKKGVMFARQRGVDETKGEIVAFIDADTKMIPGWYEQIIDKFSKDLILVSLSGPYIYENISLYTRILVFIFYYLILLPVYYALGYTAIFGNFAIRRSVLEKMGGLNTDIVFYGDDTDTVQRAHKFGKTVFSLNFKIKTSPRRFEQEGIVFTAWRYVINFIHIVLFNKPHTNKQTILR
jgi:glycosyltransferase involved in cell wall biosynthesis